MVRKLGWWASAVLGVALLASAACGSGSSGGKTPAATAPVATSAASSPTAAASPAAPATASTSGGSTAPAGGTTELTLVASNLLFDKSELKAAPGTIKVTVDNKDAGVPHNIHFFKGEDASGESAGMTDLTVGPAKETLTLNLAKGDYFFQCDAHPATMAGKLDVE